MEGGAIVSKEIEYEVYSLPAALMMQHNMSQEVVANLNNYLDVLRSDKHKESASKFLVGQIRQGEQLSMDYMDNLLTPFVSIVESLGMAYLNHFVEYTKSPLKPKKISIDKLWSVHSYEGDYNPIHDHLTTSNMGISFTTWTKVPDQIVKPNEEDSLRYELYENSGAIDGFINFTYGLNQTGDPEKLRPSQSRYVKPEPGKLLMFPSWMQHCVYPFFGEGERRTVAGNLNCFDLTREELEELKENEV
tara:strand:- start:169 stop:909 length:741 start_codon:yes stop_codon:yes gene_type:complete